MKPTSIVYMPVRRDVDDNLYLLMPDGKEQRIGSSDGRKVLLDNATNVTDKIKKVTIIGNTFYFQFASYDSAAYTGDTDPIVIDNQTTLHIQVDDYNVLNSEDIIGLCSGDCRIIDRPIEQPDGTTTYETSEPLCASYKSAHNCRHSLVDYPKIGVLELTMNDDTLEEAMGIFAK